MLDRRAAILICATVALLPLLFSLGGCGTRNPYPPGSFERGQRYYEKNKPHEAVEVFNTFIRQNPTDSLAAKAQYLKALSYIEIKEYPLAAVELKILRKDYPTSELVEDAYFYEGVAYFKQVGRIERDVTGAYDARAHFLKFLEFYPNSEYAEQARDYLQQVSDMVVRKRLSAANVYRHLGEHGAVMVVMETTLLEEADSSLLAEVLYRLGEAAYRLGESDKARTAYQRLVDEYPDSRYAGAARGRLNSLPATDGS
jgi:outer membrane protein assembly factor BamD